MANTMSIGLTMFATDRSMAVPALAQSAEERGFDSVWIPEHTHIPTSRETPPPMGEDELPEYYKRSVDPLVALAAAAAVTQTVRLGTGIMLPAQREPIVTAKAIATNEPNELPARYAERMQSVSSRAANASA